MVLLFATSVLPGCVLPGPPLPWVAMFERTIEARSFNDIAEDYRILLDANARMVDVGTLDASTEVYEQRLLVTGVFDDQETHDRLRNEFESIDGVKRLYWHAAYLTETEREQHGRILDWPHAVYLDNSVGVNLVKTADVADINLRVAADPLSTIYLLGRARSPEEHEKAIQVARETTGVRDIVDYIEIRP
jgi:hyperosmotically inducible protein